MPLSNQSRSARIRRGGIGIVAAALMLHSSAAVLAQAGSSITIKVPYRSQAKAKQLIETIALRVKLAHDYQERGGNEAAWRTQGAPGVILNRFFSKDVDGLTKTLELAIARFPGGGFELHLYGIQGAGNDGAPNSDLTDVELMIGDLLTQIETAQADPNVRPDVGYQVLQLGYVQSDRALALFKTLGYTCVEYTGDEAADSMYEKIFTAKPEETDFSGKYPVIVKLIDSAKTSLMDAPKAGAMETGGPAAGEGETLPDLGGLYLHGVTSGEPPQRLLVIYEKDKPEQIEGIMNLLEQQIDVPAQQILINALIIELNADKLSDIGLAMGNSGVSSGGNGSKREYDATFGQPPTLDKDGKPVNSTADFDPFSFIFNRSNLGGTFGFEAKLKALVERGDAEILSNPSVLVLDGRQARIQIGQNRPVVTQTKSQFSESSDVKYFPIGIVLNLRPRIAEGGGEVVMQVETIVSSVVLTASGGGSGTSGVLSAPIVDNRQVQTFVRVANDTPFIIGGLISTELSESISGVPLLSEIPVLGALFRRTTNQRQKKEVIVVLTPHVIPKETKNFSYVIPQETEIFDSFDHNLFRNAYRVREQDVYDLKFLKASEFYDNLRGRVRDAVAGDRSLRDDAGVAQVLAGGIPGEDVLVRRMLWEIVGRKDFAKHIDPKRMIFFEESPDAADGSGFKLSFLTNVLASLDPKGENACVLTYDTNLAGTPEHPFVQPRATVSYETIPANRYVAELMKSNTRMEGGSPDQWSAVLSDDYAGVSASPMEALKRVLVLKRILALNSSLPLTLAEFYPGRQIIFPTEADLSERFHLLDPEAMRIFYEVMIYYPAFEQEFMYQTGKIMSRISGGAE